MRPNPIGSRPASVNYRLTPWERFDGFIASIGDWFAEYSEAITGILALLLGLCIAIPFVVWLISLGWVWGIIAGLTLGVIVYYATMMVMGIFIWVGNIMLGAIRYIFYSGTSFLIVLGIVCVALAVSKFYPFQDAKEEVQVENVVPVTTRYRCTASTSLNVRSAPNSYAQVLGKLRYGQLVDVYEISGGFARIKYNNRDAYISVKYIEKTD